jgi:hypothetical protein
MNVQKDWVGGKYFLTVPQPVLDCFSLVDFNGYYCVSMGIFFFFFFRKVIEFLNYSCINKINIPLEAAHSFQLPYWFNLYLSVCLDIEYSTLLLFLYLKYIDMGT